MCNENKSFVLENLLKSLLRKLITLNVGYSPDTSLQSLISEPPFSVINIYLLIACSFFQPISNGYFHQLLIAGKYKKFKMIIITNYQLANVLLGFFASNLRQNYSLLVNEDYHPRFAQRLRTRNISISALVNMFTDHRVWNDTLVRNFIHKWYFV